MAHSPQDAAAMLLDPAAFDPDLPDELRAPNAASAWTRAREDYQAGESAAAVCERYRLSRSVFFKRAKEEGWRKRDAPGAEPDAFQDDMEADLVADLLRRPATPAYALYRRSWALAEVALHRRRRLEAMSWLRVAKELRKLAMEEMNLVNWPRTALTCEEAAAAKTEAEAKAQKDVDRNCEEPVLEGSSPLSSEPVAVRLKETEQSFPPDPLGGCGEDRITEDKPRPHRDDPLPMSILGNPKKLRAYLKAEFGWPRDPADSADSADQSTRTPLSSLPSEDGEVSPQLTEGAARERGKGRGDRS